MEDRSPVRPGLLVSLAVPLALAVGGCSDPATGPSSRDAPVAFALSVAGPPEAFDRADRVAIRVLASNAVVLDTVLEFRSSGGDVRLRVRVPRGEEGARYVVEVEVRLGSQTLFTGSAGNVELSGSTEPVEITLQPVVAALVVPAGIPTIPAIGGTLQLTAAAVFATGDTVPGVTFTWSSVDPKIISVTPGGMARGLAEGDGRVEVRAGNAVAMATVRVRASVASVIVIPDRVSIVLGALQAFAATARDAAGNILNRAFTWSSTNVAVVTVDAGGRAQGVGLGSASVSATTENVTGSALVTVVPPVPATPTSLAALPSGTTVRLTWVDNATDETSYEVYRGQAGSTQRVRIAILPPNATEYSENAGVDLELAYSVRACNAAGCAESAVVTTITVPAPPSGLVLTVTDSAAGTIVLSWKDGSQTEAEFIIEVGDSDGGWASFGAVPANTVSLATSIPLYYFLYFRVAACNQAGCSSTSNEVDVYLYGFAPGPARPAPTEGNGR